MSDEGTVHKSLMSNFKDLMHRGMKVSNQNCLASQAVLENPKQATDDFEHALKGLNLHLSS